MRVPVGLSLLALALDSVACSSHFNPGRCDSTSDCQAMAGYSGYVCDLDSNIQGDGRCVPPCAGSSDCQGGRICNFDTQGVGRCLFPVGGGLGGSTGTGGQAGGTGSGGSVAGSGGKGGGAGAGGSTDGGGPDLNPCNACGGDTPICLQATCVQCATSSDCKAAASKPICDTTSHTCTACTSDSQCVTKLGSTGNPGVCRSEIDGHCATDAETIYVQNTTGCTTTFVSNSGGTASAPYCSMEPVALATNATKTLVVIRGTVGAPDWTYQRGVGQPATTFVGQQSGVIASATTPGFSMDSGVVYIRNVKFSPSATVCIEADRRDAESRNRSSSIAVRAVESILTGRPSTSRTRRSRTTDQASRELPCGAESSSTIRRRRARRRSIECPCRTITKLACCARLGSTGWVFWPREILVAST